MFSPEVKEKAMIACGRRCCLCHKFCGVGMESHHMKPQLEGGDDSFENCIPLCFDCHAEAGHYSPSHPKGTKFTPTELAAHRDRWYSQVSNFPAPTSPQTQELDRKLFNRILVMLAGSGYMVHFRDHDYGDLYMAEYDDRLSELLFSSVLPEFEFFDAQVESAFADLASAIKKYKNDALNRIWREPGHITGIPREWQDNGPQEKRFWEAVEVMNKTATLLWDAYCEFVRIGRLRLQAEEPSEEQIISRLKSEAAKRERK